MKQEKPYIAIACGGTGGHLFPGMAVAEELLIKGCQVGLIVSSKEVDQQIARSVIGSEVLTISAKAVTSRGAVNSLAAFIKATGECKDHFQSRKPKAVLAMGGFTSPPAIFAGRKHDAALFLHEANAIPGKAVRWLAHFVDEVFVHLHEASSSISHQQIHTVGMPVRSQFSETSLESCRMALGLDATKPVVLVVGGSQGASGINDLVMRSLPVIKQQIPNLQFFHLTGPNDTAKVGLSYKEAGVSAVVKSFFTEMEIALGAATVAISRSGASSLAEFAALKVPTIAIPYPHAADNHQYYNALHFAGPGGAKILEQQGATPEQLVKLLGESLDPEGNAKMREVLAKLYLPDAAAIICNRILDRIGWNPQAGTRTFASLASRKPQNSLQQMQYAAL